MTIKALLKIPNSNATIKRLTHESNRIKQSLQMGVLLSFGRGEGVEISKRKTNAFLHSKNYWKNMQYWAVEIMWRKKNRAFAFYFPGLVLWMLIFFFLKLLPTTKNHVQPVIATKVNCPTKLPKPAPSPPPPSIQKIRVRP